MAEYITVERVQEETDTSASTEEIEAAIALAQSLIDARAQTTFGKEPPESVFIYDVRGDTAVLPFSYSAINSVKVDNSVISSLSYEKMPYAIRFSMDLLPRISGRGQTIEIEADFIAQPVPLLIQEAALLLASQALGESSASDSVIPNLPSDIKSFSVEGLSVTREVASSASDSGYGPSTGNEVADRLIDLTVGYQVGIA